MKIAILDDYANEALTLADWSKVTQRAQIDVFTRHLGGPVEIVEALRDYDIICTMRERTAMPEAVLAQLPRLKLLCFTGERVVGIDIAAATRRGIVVCRTETRSVGSAGTTELAWGIILSLFRHIPENTIRMRSGGWQERLGCVLEGKTLGLLGLGRLGGQMATVGREFGMEVLAWSQNLTALKAQEKGAVMTDKEDLFRRSDVVSLHLVLSERTHNIVGATEFELMKPTAFLINTSRGGLVDEASLLRALRTRRIAGAGLDVFHREPLPDDDPIRTMPNVVLTPHLGYSVVERMRDYYADTAENILGFLDGRPVHVVAT